MSLLPKEYDYICDKCGVFFKIEHPLHILNSYECESCYNESFNKIFSEFLTSDTAYPSQTNKTIKFELRGDDLQMIDKIINKIDIENEDIHSWLCYLKNEVIDQIK